MTEADIDYSEQARVFRSDHTTIERTAPACMSIDPGFVHHRLIQNIIGKGGIEAVNAALASIPADTQSFLRQLQTDHLYVEAVVTLCSHIKAPSLSELLAQGHGRLFCSVETVAPSPAIYNTERVISEVVPKTDVPLRVQLSYSADRVVSDTTRMELASGSEVAIIAQLRHHDKERAILTFEPLVIGGPSLEVDPKIMPESSAIWLGFAFGEVFAEDIDEFSAIRGVPVPPDIAIMQRISEHAVKTCLAEILGQSAPKDWGGEQSDLYSAHLHLSGRQTTGAFLLKGPARFTPMGLNHLGKNNDQIVRLANEPAEVLIVQHCHEILSPVRSTLRAFANSLGTIRRRYCLVDGADTLRILEAYGKIDRALELSGG
jgi:hypothetical protein